MLHRVSKFFYISAGSLFLALGVLGAFLPLLPTTIFLLVASACYIRGSARLHRWLHHHKYFGPYLQNIRDRRMPVRAKIMTLVMLWASLGYSLYVVDDLYIRLPLLITLIGLTIYISRLETARNAPELAP